MSQLIALSEGGDKTALRCDSAGRLLVSGVVSSQAQPAGDISEASDIPGTASAAETDGHDWGR